MSDKSLRNKIIRLAHANPELRKDLLPLLNNKKANQKFVGETYQERGVRVVKTYKGFDADDLLEYMSRTYKVDTIEEWVNQAIAKYCKIINMALRKAGVKPQCDFEQTRSNEWVIEYGILEDDYDLQETLLKMGAFKKADGELNDLLKIID